MLMATTSAIMFLALLFVHMSTPLTLGMMIILMTLMVSFMLFSLLTTSWFSYLLVILFLSGIMVIFVYVSSLAANEFFSQIPLSNLLNPVLITIMMMPMTYSMTLQTLSKTGPPDTLALQTIYKIYTNQMALFSVFLILYLLVALIVVVKNSSLTHSPLRST